MHVIKRGGRGMNIVQDNEDKVRFSRSLFYLNDKHSDPEWHFATAHLNPPDRPDHWPDRIPLVRILAWTLLPNHFHLLLEEIREGGIALFMQSLCCSMTKIFNSKYDATGSIFQGAYRGKVVDNDTYLRTVLLYIVVKNVLEQYPGGLKRALQRFDDAWEWGIAYPFSSLLVHARGNSSPIIEPSDLLNLFRDQETFKREAKEMLTAYMEKRNENEVVKSLFLEKW